MFLVEETDRKRGGRNRRRKNSLYTHGHHIPTKNQTRGRIHPERETDEEKVSNAQILSARTPKNVIAPCHAQWTAGTGRCTTARTRKDGCLLQGTLAVCSSIDPSYVAEKHEESQQCAAAEPFRLIIGQSPPSRTMKRRLSLTRPTRTIFPPQYVPTWRWSFFAADKKKKRPKRKPCGDANLPRRKRLNQRQGEHNKTHARMELPAPWPLESAKGEPLVLPINFATLLLPPDPAPPEDGDDSCGSSPPCPRAAVAAPRWRIDDITSGAAVASMGRVAFVERRTQ